jgi:site-specific DNA-methyltransferase (adenine-specific)
MAMFPPSIPHVFIEWLTRPGEVVYDPFAGRGTVPFEAGLMGRMGLGSDNNPMACLLTGAKVDPPHRKHVDERLDQLYDARGALPLDGVPPHVRPLFSDFTLSHLLWLRAELNTQDGLDRFLLALLLGKLHGNADAKGQPAGLTVAMPNTFAMAPRYVARYIKEHGLKPPEADPVAFLRRHVDTTVWPGRSFRRGAAWQQDVREDLAWPARRGRAKLVFTSPPYLGVMKYGKFNWIRLWLLGHDPQGVDAALFSSESLDRYRDFLSLAIRHVRPHVRDDGFICLVLGDVRRENGELNLAREVGSALEASDFTHVGTVVDDLPVDHKVSRIWGASRGRATKTDRILILAGPRAEQPGPVPTFGWRD